MSHIRIGILKQWHQNIKNTKNLLLWHSSSACVCVCERERERVYVFVQYGYLHSFQSDSAEFKSKKEEIVFIKMKAGSDLNQGETLKILLFLFRFCSLVGPKKLKKKSKNWQFLEVQDQTDDFR